MLRTRAVWTAPIVGVLAATLMACGSPGTNGSPGSGAGNGGSSGAGIDACTLIPAATVTTLIGPNGGGVARTSLTGRDAVCDWKNSTTQGLVILSIGAPGTAAGGALPPVGANVAEFYSPLPDGMRQYGVDKVEFVAGDRLCSARVASDPLRPTTEKDRDAAIALARDVRGRL